jgi:hypothetical protein
MEAASSLSQYIASAPLSSILPFTTLAGFFVAWRANPYNFRSGLPKVFFRMPFTCAGRGGYEHQEEEEREPFQSEGEEEVKDMDSVGCSRGARRCRCSHRHIHLMGHHQPCRDGADYTHSSRFLILIGR